MPSEEGADGRLTFNVWCRACDHSMHTLAQCIFHFDSIHHIGEDSLMFWKRQKSWRCYWLWNLASNRSRERPWEKSMSMWMKVNVTS